MFDYWRSGAGNNLEPHQFHLFLSILAQYISPIWIRSPYSSRWWTLFRRLVETSGSSRTQKQKKGLQRSHPRGMVLMAPSKQDGFWWGFSFLGVSAINPKWGFWWYNDKTNKGTNSFCSQCMIRKKQELKEASRTSCNGRIKFYVKSCVAWCNSSLFFSAQVQVFAIAQVL